ncbi:MAG: hypothetical protein ACI8XC_002751 [Gammaproteobacteria bacterium]|jgi:hypothetical protein
MTSLSLLEKQQLQSVAEPIWKNIISASRDKDYARFSRGFSPELRGKLSEEHFAESCREYPLLTSVSDDFQFIDVISRSGSMTLLWRVESNQFDGEFLGQLTLQKLEGGLQITGVSIT